MRKKILISAPKFYGIDEAIRDAFEDVGFEAVLINYRPTALLEKIIRKAGLKPLSQAVTKYYLELENKEFEAAIRQHKPDLIFIIKGEQLFPQTLERIKKQAAVPVIAYIWDDPFYSYAGAFTDVYRRTNFEKGMHLYDLIFVYDTFYVRQIKERGPSKVEYLPLATDAKRFRPITVDPPEAKGQGYDLCFVGTPYPNRLEVLEVLKGFNLGVFGEGWEKFFSQRGEKVPSYYKGKAVGNEVLKIYLSSKIVLNIHDPEAKEGLNTRTFDIPACGACQLVDYKKNLDMHFQIGEDIASFKDPKELVGSVEHYLKNPEVLKAMALKGRQRVLNEHTWTHRAQRVLELMKQNHILIEKDVNGASG